MKSETPDPKTDETPAPTNVAVKHGKGRRRGRWWQASLMVLALLTVGVWLGREPITKLAETTVIQHLNENGLYPRYAKRSWSPWGGLYLEQLILYRNAGGNEPIVEVSALDVTFPWYQIWKTRKFISHWYTQGATVTLHDAAGEVTFKNLTSTVELEGGDIEVRQLQFSEEAITAMLAGQILFTVKEGPRPEIPREFVIDLGVVRAVQAALDIKPGTGPFFVRGKFAVDGREGAGTWQADLHGQGTQVVWRDVPLPNADVKGHLTDKGLNLDGNLGFTHGSAVLKASREDWARSPLVIAGQIADSAQRRDEVSVSYNGDSHTMMLASIRGTANLLEFAQSFPSLVRVLPSGVKLRNAPEMSLTKLVYREGKGSWSLGSLALHSPADITLSLANRPLEIDQLTGHASFDGHEWRLGDVAGNIAGGRFAVAGTYADGVARDASVELTDLRFKELSPWLGESSEAFQEAQLSLDYHGALGTQADRWNGSGGVRMENAPVVKVPLLDETYAFFGELSPGMKRSGTGDLRSSFTGSRGVFEVSGLKATGEAVTVTGSGVVDFVRRQVDGRAHANIRGVAGLATSVLSKVLEMKVSGPLDHIRLQPLNPAEMLGEGVAGAAELPGKALKEGVNLPIKIFDWLGGKPSEPKARP